ncbi:MAG TPA: patatin-like phospholipase family protein [Gemmatimonadaceae bacterium]|nr:patatin-like phospholipase family protein [Gemmatimonadaceae bacterium]
MSVHIPPRTALVLGGGGLKGFAHIGVLRALEERGVQPAVVAGTSIGALIGAAWAQGLSPHEMARRAESLQRRDLFRINHVGMIVERMRCPSLYLEEPLRNLCESVVGGGTFHSTRVPLLVNTVDIERGTQLVWGLPGLRDVRVADAVYASCALPGVFPPGQVDGRLCVDGGTVDNLPVSPAAVGMQAVIAVDVGSSDLTRSADIATQGFASIYMRAATVMMHTLQTHQLADWDGPPLLLIRPRLAQYGWFGFGVAREIIEIGYEAAHAALDNLGTSLLQRGGVYPRRMVEIEVDDEKCIGCRTCVALAPRLMRMDASQKAYAVHSPLEWSPADGEFVHHCPTQAITARWLDGTGSSTAPEREPSESAAD